MLASNPFASCALGLIKSGYTKWAIIIFEFGCCTVAKTAPKVLKFWKFFIRKMLNQQNSKSLLTLTFILATLLTNVVHWVLRRFIITQGSQVFFSLCTYTYISVECVE